MNFRKFFSFILACLLISSSAFAGDIQIQEDGITEKSAARKLNFSTGMDVAVAGGIATITVNQTPSFSTLTVTGQSTLSGDVVGDGGDQMQGFLQNQITSTTTTLTIAQCGSTIVNDSADVLTLPEASTALGCRYTFAVANASNLDVNPNDGTDQILPFADYAGAGATVSPAAGDAIRGATAGMSITLEAVGANAWAVINGAQGTWADVN